jgi:hypothetical protein
LKDATTYVVALRTVAKPVYVGTAIQLYSSGGPVLGGIRSVSRDSTNSAQIHLDVETCVNESLKHGLIVSFFGRPPSAMEIQRELAERNDYRTGGYYVSHYHRSVQGFLKRFDSSFAPLKWRRSA